MKGTLFLISAPSGAGKTTIVNAVLEHVKNHYGDKLVLEKVITYTTRPKREGEVEEKDYFFITKEDFLEKIESGFFMEWSTWYENYYGSPAWVLDRVREGISYIAIVDRFGARSIKAIFPEVVLIWLAPVSLEVLEQRLIRRGTDLQQEIEKRLLKAALEMDEEKKEKIYEYHIINDDFNKTVQKVINCIVVEIMEK